MVRLILAKRARRLFQQKSFNHLTMRSEYFISCKILKNCRPFSFLLLTLFYFITLLYTLYVTCVKDNTFQKILQQKKKMSNRQLQKSKTLYQEFDVSF